MNVEEYAIGWGHKICFAAMRGNHYQMEIKMKFDYTTLDNHIKLRGGLPPKIANILLPQKRKDWPKAPQF